MKKTNQQVIKTLRPTEIHTRINKKVNLENESHKVILVISIKAKSKISNYPEKKPSLLKVVPQSYEGISGSDKIKISFPLINVLSTFKPCNKLKIFKIPKYHSFLSKCGDVLVARGKGGKGGFGRFKFLRRSPTPPMVGLPLTSTRDLFQAQIPTFYRVFDPLSREDFSGRERGLTLRPAACT